MRIFEAEHDMITKKVQSEKSVPNWGKKMSPPPPTPASERSTKPRPTIQRAAPKNCHKEYRVPRKIHVRIMTHGMVQQSNNVTLVIDEY